jgi:two-component system invasion response regulator UvrY
MKTHLIINSKKLSPREKQVAIYIAEGLCTKDIAERMKVKSNTISTFKKKIFAKLEVVSIIGLYKRLNG